MLLQWFELLFAFSLHKIGGSLIHVQGEWG